MEINRIENFTEWDKWKQSMKKAVNLGEAVGFSEKSIDDMAFRIGSFLQAAVDPENREQRVLKELWKVGDDGDRKMLARLIVKMVQTDEVEH